MKTNSSYMENTQSIPLHPPLALAFGVPAALILQQVRYWMDINERRETRQPVEARQHYREGRWWVYNSYTEWQAGNFIFLSEDTIERQIRKLEDLGVLLSGDFNASVLDHTKWYTIDFDVLDRLTAEAVAGYREKLDQAQRRSPQNAEIGHRHKRRSPQNAVIATANCGDLPDNTLQDTTTDSIPPFDTIARLFWGIDDIALLRKGQPLAKEGARIGMCEAALKKLKPTLTSQDVQNFHTWWAQNNPRLSLKDSGKMAGHFHNFLSGTRASNAPVVELDPAIQEAMRLRGHHV